MRRRVPLGPVPTRQITTDTKTRDSRKGRRPYTTNTRAGLGAGHVIPLALDT
jgi:hypothetical protein